METAAIPPATMDAAPCLAVAATLLLQTLATGKRVGEYGAGGSTLWLAQIAAEVISVEDNAAWFSVVTRYTSAFAHVEVRLVTTAGIPRGLAESDGLFDVLFVDPLPQKQRYQAIVAGAPLVRPGGWLVADDYDFPHVKAGVKTLAGWDVAIVVGVKLHPVKRVLISTATAFCQRPQRDTLL